MNRNWYYHRLSCMSPAEAAWRLRRFLGQMTAKTLRRTRSSGYEKRNRDPAKLVETLDQVHFYGLADIRQQDVPESWVKRTVAEAELLLQHRHTIFAMKDLFLGKPIKWNREHKRGIDLPLEFGLWMDYRDARLYGDCKYFWEPARLQHLITLSKAYFLTGDEKFAEEVTDQIVGFMEQCPYLLGFHWTMAMEAGIRLISISWAAMFLKQYLTKNVRLCQAINEFAAMHADFVAANLSLYSSANNHLIAEIAGLFLASVCFAHLPNMERYRATAHRIASKEITHQFYPDGVNCEQSTCYHISCYESFLLVGLLGQSNGIPFTNEFWSRLEQAAKFICDLAGARLTIPHIGDSDDGRNVLLSELRDNGVRSLLAVGATLFSRPDLKERVQEYDETSFWLLGQSGQRKFNSIKTTVSEPRKSIGFEHSGYYILRSDAPVHAKVIFDCGPLGMGPIAAHGHADALNVLLYVYGREFFTDPGTYTYATNDPYRDYFRSTAAHNTIVVDGQDQSKMAGPFLWIRKTVAHVEQWTQDAQADRISGWHDGYLHLPDAVMHRRTVELDKSKFVVSIFDHIQATKRHEIAQYFHMAPECRVEQIGLHAFRISKEGHEIELQADPKLSCRILRGSENPRAGWVSRKYDEKVATNTLVCATSAKANQEFLTRINLVCE